MRREIPVLLNLLELWGLFMLLFPKRTWREIPSRMAALADGRRDRLHGSSSIQAAAPAGLGIRAASEALLLLEAGLPVYLLALAAKSRGERRRTGRRNRWEKAVPGLVWKRLSGAISGKQLRAEVAQLGYWPALGLAAEAGVRQHVVPPMSWRLEWDARRAAATTPAPATMAAPGANGTRALTRIQALGPLHPWAGDEDLAPELLVRRRPAFTWVYLLAREVLGPKAYATRDTLADETVPGLDAQSRRNTLNNRLSHLRTIDPIQPVGETVEQDGIYVHVYLRNCTFDARELFDLLDKVEEAGPLLRPSLALRVEDTLESHAGEFLPEWDELEMETTQGKSATSDVIREARRKVENARAHLLVALGDSYLARQEPTRAVRYFEQALDRQPDIAATARKLADACAQSGQGGYANQVRLRYGLEEAQPRPRPRW
jgi:tetratricopeptide (TPR) repeat protein